MSPLLAFFLWLILLLGLVGYDPAKKAGTSAVLWIPVVWIFIIGSRLPSQWFGGPVGQSAQILEEGNSLDRNIFFLLILLSLVILLSRSFNWGNYFANNIALVVFLSFGLFSVLWSDFAFVAFKRWFRDIGNYLVILVALSDPQPFEAVRTVLRRLCYLLIPLSILLIKYYPNISRQYDGWTGSVTFTGAATSKNMLGVVCLLSGLFFLWDTVNRWCDPKGELTKGILIVNLSLIAMTLWLLIKSSSATSKLCLIIGCAVIVAAHLKSVRRRLGLLKVVIPTGVFLYLVLAFVFGIDVNSVVAGAFGRDPTLTDRTHIWKIVLSLHTNPLVGTGYESFWLGPRLQKVWSAGFGKLNEAHNGYLQVYLNLGFIGVFLLGWFLISSYRTICRSLDQVSSLGSFSLALWTVLIFYNYTEAAFVGGLLWLALLPGVITVDWSGDELPRTLRYHSLVRPETRKLAKNWRYSRSLK